MGTYWVMEGAFASKGGILSFAVHLPLDGQLCVVRGEAAAGSRKHRPVGPVPSQGLAQGFAPVEKFYRLMRTAVPLASRWQWVLSCRLHQAY